MEIIHQENRILLLEQHDRYLNKSVKVPITKYNNMRYSP